MPSSNPNPRNQINLAHLNCKGIYSKIQEIRQYLQITTPTILCTTETWLSTREPTLRNYTSYWKNRDNFGGGVGISVLNEAVARKFDIRSYNGGVLEFLAIEIYSNNRGWIKILCLYNPCKCVTKQEFKFYLNQLGNTFVIMGDLNAHSPYLDGKFHNRSNTTGLVLEDLILNQNLVLINAPDAPTYVDYKITVSYLS